MELGPQLLVNTGALGIVAWVIVHVLRVQVPAMLAQFSTEMAAERASRKAETTAIVDELVALRRAFGRQNTVMLMLAKGAPLEDLVAVMSDD